MNSRRSRFHSVSGQWLDVPFLCLFIVLLISAVPIQSAWAQIYRVQHCFLGCPVGADSGNDLLLRSIYALSFNSELKTAEWVAYEVDAGAIGIASALSRQPVADEPAINTLTEEEFLANENSRYVRAQYVPLVSFAATPYWNEVNYLSNSVARSKSLSEGAWYGLDWAVRNLVNRAGEVYVVTGPVFYDDIEPKRFGLPRQHRIPDAFYKVIANKEGQAAAFLFPQDTAVHVHHCDLQSTITEIERLTALNLFPEAEYPLDLSLQNVLGCN